MHLNSYLDIETVSDTYSYISPKKKATQIWTFLFGLLSGDMNPIHINPFTSMNFKSRLGGLSRHGISTLAQAESFIFKVLKFKEPTEIIAKGYNSIDYAKPVRIGDKLIYTYTLLRKKVNVAKKYSQCIWQIKGTNQQGEDVFSAEWVIMYFPIQKNLIKARVYPAGWLLGGSVELEDTPTRIFWARLTIFICLGVTVWIFAHFWFNS